MRWKSIWLSLVFAFWWEGCQSLKGSDLILQAKLKAAEEKLNPTTEEVIVGEDGNTTIVTVKKPLLTGIPQKDYIHDPNLPRELKGHNLTNYPFYNGVPEDIEFECDGLHDGFYASVPHHCQVYHHCLFGTRYDFLCANYTAFDQKTFICHFVSEVDCVNSPKYYIRNEALYKAQTSPPPPTTTTTATTTTKPTTTTRKPRRRRPQRRRRPYYDYYYDSEEYEEDYYDEEEEDPLPPPRKSGRKQRPSQGNNKKEEETTTTTTTTTTVAAPSAGGEPPLTRAPASVYSKNRIPPKIRPPVPVNERHKYEYKTTPGPLKNRHLDEEDEEYYDDEYDDPLPLPPKKKDSGRDKMSRRRQQGGRKRPSRYDDEYYEEEEEERPRRKGTRKDDDYRRHRNRKGGYRVEDDERPMRGGSRKRNQEETRRERRPAEYEYYDDEEEEDKYERPRSRKPEKRMRTTTKKYERTTEAPDEEYEEYEEDEEETKVSKKDTTTSAPHRFSTSAYKNVKSTTSRPAVNYKRPKPTPDQERRYRPITKRVESSTEETTTNRRPIVMKATVFPDRKFTSIVGTPAGFRKPEEKGNAEMNTEATKEEIKTETSRKPQDVYRKFSNFRRQQEDDRKENNPSKNIFTSKEDETLSPKEPENNSPPKSDESTRYRNPSRTEDNGAYNRNKQIRVFDSSVRNEEINSSTQTPLGDQLQNFRKPPNKVFENPFPKNEDSISLRNSYKEENAAVSDVTPSEQHKEENSKPLFRYTNRNDEQPYRNPITRQQEERTERPANPFRNSYRQEETSVNYRNPTATADEEQYQTNPVLRHEGTLINYRSQPTNVGNSNYRNPHTSADDVRYKPADQTQYKISGFIPNDPYERPDISWPSKEDSFMPMQPTSQPPLEEVKQYATGPGSDQTQEGSNKPGYPPAITSPPRGYRRYGKMKVSVRPKPVTEENIDFNKYPIPIESPKVEFTAPGPSAPQATPRPYLDLEEYDVTLNDALQPSTPYSHHKSRGYQSTVTNPSYRGGYLLTAASQTYPSKIPGEFEAVVVPSQRYVSKRRPHEWYW